MKSSLKSFKLFLILFAGISMLFFFACEENTETLNGPAVNEIPAMDEEAILEELLREQPDVQMLERRGISIAIQPVLTFDLREVGRAIMARHRNGVLTVLRSDEVTPGHAVTMWFVVFNRPENCVDDCDDPDLVGRIARADLLYADGGVINGDGRHYFIGRLREGDTSASIMPELFDQPSLGLEDSRDAEIHLVLRDHGPLVPGMEEQMTTTFNGGCQGLPPVLGEPGPNDCVDTQFAAFPAQ